MEIWAGFYSKFSEVFDELDADKKNQSTMALFFPTDNHTESPSIKMTDQ